ncbi:hypothetical protein GLOIN_2v1729495 [Rhizophagus clarus]|uniref:Crinkler effector protein N-terminal domain-containing protein n=1 Tax=Rhizophagus clarus TaxID=94130 RepID=A0A8H3QYA1_9GLOM|nr:hypothetical protein GLOIN_2v1729495 [Rhizophagus clarus]
MYSEKYIKNEMLFSFNCLVSEQTPNDIINVPIGEFFTSEGKVDIKFTDMTVANFKEQLYRTKEVKEANITKMDIYKVELELDSLEENKTYTENDINVPTSTAGPSQGVPRATSIEDAMKKILEGIHESMAVGVDEPKSMALKQRDFKQAIDVIDRNFCNSLVKQKTEKKATPTAKTNYRILLCGGAPGIGKTRYGIELFDWLDKEWEPSKGQKPYMLYMLLDFSNGYALDEYEIQGDMKIASEIILGLRLAYYFFVNEKYVMSFEMFRIKANEYKHLFKLDNVLAHIYSHEHERLQPGQHLFIFLQIDEFQLIFKDRKEGAELFKQLMYVLGHHMVGKIPNIFVQTLLSGTAPQDAIRAMEPTMYTIEPLDLPLLSLESRLEIMREFATNHGFFDYLWVPHIWIHQLLLDTGGLPRALEYLFTEFFGKNFTNVKEFFDKLETKNPSRIYNKIVHKLDDAYNISTYANDHKKLIYEVVYRNIMEIESKMSDELQDGSLTIKLEHLGRDKHLILRKLEETRKVLIDIPYFFMYIYADELGIFSNKLDRAFLPDSDWSWEDFEVFIADFIASKIRILDVLEKTKLLKLGDFFRGAQGSDVTLNLSINFEPIQIYKLKHQFPCPDLSAKEGNYNLENLEPGYIMINGYSAPFADVFFLVNNPEPILIAIQCRKRKKSLDLETIKDEHKKNVNVSSKANEKARKLKNDAKISNEGEKLQKEAERYTEPADFLSKYRVITIFITTQRFREELEDLPNDCILIHQENFDIFFGPAFSSRTKFVMTRDSNPNLSTASELTSRFKEIKIDIGEKIEKITRKRKTFRSHEEFCKEFPDLAEDDEIRNNFVYYPYPPHIESFEHSNKRTLSHALYHANLKLNTRKKWMLVKQMK